MLTPSKGLYTAESDRTHGASSTAQGIGLRRAVAGSACPFTVTAHDATGARRPKGGDMVLCRLTYPPEGDGAAETEPIEGQVCDNLDGTYSVTYRPTLAREGPLLRVSINGAPINGSPFRIDVDRTELEWTFTPWRKSKKRFLKWSLKCLRNRSQTHARPQCSVTLTYLRYCFEGPCPSL